MENCGPCNNPDCHHCRAPNEPACRPPEFPPPENCEPCDEPDFDDCRSPPTENYAPHQEARNLANDCRKEIIPRHCCKPNCHECRKEIKHHVPKNHPHKCHGCHLPDCHECRDQGKSRQKNSGWKKYKPRKSDSSSDSDDCGRYSSDDECIHPDEFIITDEMLLDYLLKKYQLDKNKLVYSLKKIKENEFKNYILKNFYKKNSFAKCKPIKEQYRILKKWYRGDIDICKEELDDFYEKNIK